MTTTTDTSGLAPGGNSPHRLLSGLVEDRLKKPPTIRDQVDVAASTLLARVPKLPEHGKEDASPEQEATSNRLLKLYDLLKKHFEVA